MNDPANTISITAEQARHYIHNFATHVLPGAKYVDYPVGRIYFDNMTDDEAVEVALGLMELEAKAAARKRIKQ